MRNKEDILNSLASLKPLDDYKKLDNLYDNLDEHFRNGRFEVVDEILSGVDVENEHIDILLGYLTASLPARHKLVKRKEFYKKIEDKFSKDYGYPYTADLLRGLE
jgi:hypothetical protein